ncbi:MAG: hypothetical protein HN368_17000 [Spirochaetales bacterium]|nr:hypothetical protein [Spirochaetales bacterium]
MTELDMIDDVLFAEPKDMQDGKIDVTANDITTNLPYVEGVHLCFDHHLSETIRVGDKSNLIIDPNQPSAARVVYEHFGGLDTFPDVPEDLMAAVDQADSADYSRRVPPVIASAIRRPASAPHASAVPRSARATFTRKAERSPAGSGIVPKTDAELAVIVRVGLSIPRFTETAARSVKGIEIDSNGPTGASKALYRRHSTINSPVFSVHTPLRVCIPKSTSKRIVI